MGARFIGWGIAVPDRIVTNDELSQTLDTSDEWITERTGHQRAAHRRHRRRSSACRRPAARHSRTPASSPRTSTSCCSRRPRRRPPHPGDGPDDRPRAGAHLPRDGPERRLQRLHVRRAHRAGPPRDRHEARPGHRRREPLTLGRLERPQYGGAARRRRGRGGARVRPHRERPALLRASAPKAPTRTCSPASTGATSRWTARRSFAAPCAWSWTRPKRPWRWRTSRPTSSASSSPTRPTSASSRRPASDSTSTWTAPSSSLDRYGNTSSASIPLAFADARENDRIHKGDYALLDRFRRRYDVGLGGRKVVQMSGPSLVILAAGRARRYGGVKQFAPVGHAR